VSLIPINLQKSERVRETAERLYSDLQAAGFEVIYDDRDARPGVKFADDELLGIPHRVVVGDKGLERGVLEYKPRSGEGATDVPVDSIVQFLRDRSHSRA
jgi:prolyl-tRNA synthetase